MTDETMSTELVTGLFKIGALKLNFEQPFQYASGLKGPIYCDNRKIIAHPELRELFLDELERLIGDAKIEFDAVAGLATAGIPHAAWLAHRLMKPMMYIRSKPKEHGKSQQIEGDPRPGQRLLLVEDLVNQASSLESAVKATLQLNLKPQMVVCLVSYDMATAVAKLHSWQMPMRAVLHYHDLRRALETSQMATAEQLAKLDKWHRAPELWS